MGRNASLSELRVLRALLDRPREPLYGLEIMSRAGVSSGVLYPILARLEERRVVEGEWEDIDESSAGRRRRKFYRLTGEGETAARALIASVVADLSLPPQSFGGSVGVTLR